MWTVMALYTGECTVVRTDAGLSDSFEVNVGLPSELLYAEYLWHQQWSMFGRRVAEWRVSLLAND